MRAVRDLDSPGPRGLRGVLGAWLQAWSSRAGASADSWPADTPWPPARCHGPVRVLVADDNPVNLMLISAQLASRGLQPVLASDGADALALACELDLDLILMDLQMPILDGLEATSALRRFEAATARPAVPVVAFSSLAPGARVLSAHGLNGSLVKPCDDEELEHCLIRWCPSYRPVPAPAMASARQGVDPGRAGWPSAPRSGDPGPGALR